MKSQVKRDLTSPSAEKRDLYSPKQCRRLFSIAYLCVFDILQAMSTDRDPGAASASTAAVFRVLDVGCGSGDSLREELESRRKILGPTAEIQMVGVDIDEPAIEQGRALYPQFLFVHAKGERLPFADHSFDAIISRVALPYMDIPAALREMRRVLKPGGELKIKLHPWTYTVQELAAEMKSGPLWRRAQRFLYRGYVITNGIALHASGFNFRFPLARRRCESFQTKKAIKQALTAAGFTRIEIPVWEIRTKWPHAGDCRAIAYRER
ncbi:MAG TPA: class I SAM-dependent methyltransferase [Edaphobacter sp.]